MFYSLCSLIHSIVTKVIQQAQAKSNVALSPALVETYSRLLVYMEIESLGIKGFISKWLALCTHGIHLQRSVYYISIKPLSTHL